MQDLQAVLPIVEFLASPVRHRFSPKASLEKGDSQILSRGGRMNLAGELLNSDFIASRAICLAAIALLSIA